MAAAPQLSQKQQDYIKTVSKARDRLIPFCEATFRRYKRAPHLTLVAKELEIIERTVVRRVLAGGDDESLRKGENDRLIIEMPPRHGKSELVSIRFPAWAVCRNPWMQFISASYGDKLATEMGRRTRNCVITQKLFPNTILRSDSKAKDLWHVDFKDRKPDDDEPGGQFYSCGVGSGVVGFGGHIITVDDPIKKRLEAESAIWRQSNWDWYQSEVVTRQEPGAAIVLVMHRWHQDDLAGRILEEEGDQKDGGAWRVLSMPAIAEENDLLKRKPGSALWPSRFPVTVLRKRERSVGPKNWNSLYQQRPSPEEGDIFKWFPTYAIPDRPPRLLDILIPIDMAYTRRKRSDFTAMCAWGYDGSRAYLMEALRVKQEAPEAERTVLAFYKRIMASHPHARVKIVYRMSVAIDRIAGQHLNRGVPVEVKDGDTVRYIYESIPAVPIKMPGGSTKEEWGRIVSVEFEAARMLIPEHAPWLEDWIEEHKQFDGSPGNHDDFVETTIIAGYDLFRGGHMEPLRPRYRFTGA